MLGNAMADDDLPQTSPEENMLLWLHTNGTKILNQNNTEVIFNGASTMSLFGYEPPDFPSQTYTPDRMVELRSHGLNLIRLDIGFSSSVYDIPESQQTPQNLTFNEQFFPSLDLLVNRCAEIGLWVDICFCVNSMSPIGGDWSLSPGHGIGFPTWMYDGSWTYFNKTYTTDKYGISDASRDFWNIDDPTAANVRLAYQTWWKAVAAHYKDSPNVIFGLYNEPQSGGGEQLWGTTTWDNRTMPSQDRGAEMYKIFVEETVDMIRSVAPHNLIFVNNAYFTSWATNPKIERPNIVVENHAYSPIEPFIDDWNNPNGEPDYFINLGWRYNQPFYLGEFGGIEEDCLQDREGTLNNIIYCNSKNVSWSYLSFRPWNDTWNPSADTWKLLENNLIDGIMYYNTSIVQKAPEPDPDPTPPLPTIPFSPPKQPITPTPTELPVSPEPETPPEDIPPQEVTPTPIPEDPLPVPANSGHALSALIGLGVLPIVVIAIFTKKSKCLRQNQK